MNLSISEREQARPIGQISQNLYKNQSEIVSQNTWSSESRAERFAFELCRVVTGEDVVKAQKCAEIFGRFAQLLTPNS